MCGRLNWGDHCSHAFKLLASLNFLKRACSCDKHSIHVVYQWLLLVLFCLVVNREIAFLAKSFRVKHLFVVRTACGLLLSAVCVITRFAHASSIVLGLGVGTVRNYSSGLGQVGHFIRLSINPSDSEDESGIILFWWLFHCKVHVLRLFMRFEDVHLTELRNKVEASVSAFTQILVVGF